MYFNNTIFDNTINFRGSSFNGNAYFRGSSFGSYAYFDDSSFNGTAFFLKSSFNRYVKFWNSSFNGYANFWNSSFKGPVGFGGSTFYLTANFGESSFKGYSNFTRSSFNGYSNFIRSSFHSASIFNESHFNRTADFLGAYFADNADFRPSTFNGTANFRDSNFAGDVRFNSSSFNGQAFFMDSTFNISHFSSSIFNQLASFNNARFDRIADFNSTQFKDDARFEDTDFRGTLYLKWAKYDRLFIRWKNIKKLGYDDAAYFALLDNFKKLGYLEDYDAFYYEYRLLHREQNWSVGYHVMNSVEDEWFLKWIDRGLQEFYGYGKKPFLPIRWSACTIILFGIIWSMAGMDGHQSISGWYNSQKASGKLSIRACLVNLPPYYVPIIILLILLAIQFAIQLLCCWRHELFNYIYLMLLFLQVILLKDAMRFSATVFLSGTRLFVDPPEKPEMDGRWGTILGFFFPVERVLGALFSILFFLAISGTVVR